MSSSSSTIHGDETDLHQDKSRHATVEPQPLPKRYDPTERTGSTIAVAGSPEPRDPRLTSHEFGHSNVDDMPWSLIYSNAAARQQYLPLPGRRRGNLPRDTTTELQFSSKAIVLDKEWSYVRRLPLLQGDRTLEDLLRELSTIEEGHGFIPKGVRDGVPSILTETEPVMTETILDSNLCDDPRPQTELYSEYHDLADVVRESERCERSGLHPISWGEEVWSRILRHAGKGVPKGHIYWQNTITAATDYAFRPLGSPYSRPQRILMRGIPRTIDYAIAIIPEQDAAAAIEDILIKSDSMKLPSTVNPIVYCGLLKLRIAVAIVTGGTDGTRSQNRVERLANWVAAWHARMDRLQSDGLIDSSTKKPPVILPLIEVVGHHWWLYFAIEDVEMGRVCICRAPNLLGSTGTPYKTYKLVASLRALMRWADGPYRLWWDIILGVSASTLPHGAVLDQN